MKTGLYMRKFLIDFKMTPLALLFPMIIGATSAIGGEIVDQDKLAPAKIAEATMPASATDEQAPRQHVKHLRAHKKFDADFSDDVAQPAQKTDAGKTSAQNAASGAAKNLSADNNSNGSAVRPAPKPRVKIVRQHVEKTSRERSHVSDNVQRPRQHDFISDIFGGDD
jgi:hypothetical protein